MSDDPDRRKAIEEAQDSVNCWLDRINNRPPLELRLHDLESPTVRYAVLLDLGNAVECYREYYSAYERLLRLSKQGPLTSEEESRIASEAHHHIEALTDELQAITGGAVCTTLKKYPPKLNWAYIRCDALQQRIEQALSNTPIHSTRQTTTETTNPAATTATTADVEPDGLFGVDGFRFGGVEVRFRKASYQYKLIQSLWDTDTHTPTPPRPLQDVIDEVWGMDNQTEDGTVRQMTTAVRKRLQAANCPIEIVSGNGFIQLTKI